MSILTSLQSISSSTRTIKLALPEDIISSSPQWSAEQQGIRDEEKRGYPANGYRLELKPDAKSIEFKIRRLTSAQHKECEAIVERVLPPVKYVEKPGRPGDPPSRVADGWNEEDPDFVKQRNEAADDRLAAIAVLGVEGLSEDLQAGSETILEKAKLLRTKLDHTLILMIVNEITRWSYSFGDPSDFFTSANSAGTTHG